MELPIDDLYTNDNQVALAASMGYLLRTMIEDVETRIDNSVITRIWN